MNPALYDDPDFDHDLDPWVCPSCGGPVVEMGTLGNRQHGRCRNCGIDVSRDLGESHQLPITMKLADRLLKTEGCHCQMEEPADGHFYGSPTGGSVVASKNPNFSRKNPGKFYEHDQMMDGFPSSADEQNGDGEGEATADCTSSLPAPSNGAVPYNSSMSCTDEEKELGPGGNIQQANPGAGSSAIDLGPEKTNEWESTVHGRSSYGRLASALDEAGVWPKKPEKVGGDGKGQATIDKKGDSLKCESDELDAADNFDAWLGAEGVETAR